MHEEAIKRADALQQQLTEDFPFSIHDVVWLSLANFYALHRIEQMLETQNQLLQEVRRMATTQINSIANLQAAMAALLGLVQGEDSAIASIIAAIQAASPTGDNPAIDAVVTQINQLATDVQTQTAAITAAVPVAAAPSTTAGAGTSS